VPEQAAQPTRPPAATKVAWAAAVVILADSAEATAPVETVVETAVETTAAPAGTMAPEAPNASNRPVLCRFAPTESPRLHPVDALAACPVPTAALMAAHRTTQAKTRPRRTRVLAFPWPALPSYVATATYPAQRRVAVRPAYLQTPVLSTLATATPRPAHRSCARSSCVPSV